MIVYRICKAKYAKSAFAGTGGLDASGRWHHKGRPVVYAAHTLSLAALEHLVHLGRRDSKMSLVWVQATIPEDVAMEVLNPASLPKNWNASPPIEATREVGTAWLVESRSAILRLPSVVIEGEFNFLLNPRHSDFRRIAVSKPIPFSFDSRLFK
jgi:RES domain-containing protein